jgi:hypothetical protein
MMAHPEGERLFAAWNAIIQVASKMHSRGVLKDQDGPLTASDLEFKTRIKAETFDLAFAFFSSREVGWLDKETVNLSENGQSSILSEHPPEVSGESPDFSPLKGREEKGREGKSGSVQGETKNKESENFHTFSKAIKEIFGLTPTRVEDEMRLWKWCQDFGSKGTNVDELRKMHSRATVLWEGKVFGPEGVLNNWDMLKKATPPKQKAVQGALN